MPDPPRIRAGRRAAPARPRRDTRGVWPLAALLAIALLVRLAGVHAGLPEVFEEAYPFKRAWAMWGWDHGTGFDPNPHWFRYPGLVIYLQLAGQALLYVVLWIGGSIHSTLDYRVLYETDKTAFYLMGRMLTAVLGAATVVPVWQLARRASGTAAAWCAGLLVALNAELAQKSWVVEVDVPMALLVALACVQALRLAEAPTRRNALIGGALAGLAAAAKYPGAIALLPVLIGLLIGLVAPPAAAAAAEGGGAPRRAPAASLAAGIAIVAAGAVAAFFIASPFTVLDFRHATAEIGWERQHMAIGHFGAAGGRSWGWYGRTWFDGALGWPAGIAAIAGLAWFAIRRRARWAIVLGVPMVVYYGIVGAWAMKADRYLIPIIPIGAVFAAAAAAVVEARAPARLPRVAAWGAAIALLVVPQAVDLAGRLRAIHDETRGMARRWMEENIPPGALIVNEFYAPVLMCPGLIDEIPPDLIEPMQKSGALGRAWAVVYLRMYQVKPERSAPFYDFRLLEPADYVVVTNPVRHRYRDDPRRFPRQNAFYDTLETRWVKVKSFEGGPVGEIVIYRNPTHTQPFAARREQPPITGLLDPASAAAEGAGYFYYVMGLNYEAFGQPRRAFDAYAEVLAFPPTQQGYRTRSALAAARLLERSGRSDQAASFLRAVEAHAGEPGEGAALRDARADLERRTGAGARRAGPSPGGTSP